MVSKEARHEIFYLWFYHSNNFPYANDTWVKAILNMAVHKIGDFVVDFLREFEATLKTNFKLCLHQGPRAIVA
jgi:hypothetical protein